MNFIDRLKKLFRNKQEVVQETSTTLSLYDVSDVFLPNINDLSEEQRNLFIQYKNEIHLDNLESVLKYNEKVSKEGEELSKLLIKILYELTEIIRRDDKTEKELQEIDINTSIKNKKIKVIREMLQRLKTDCDIRTLAIQSIVKEYENKEHKFIEIFSRAARIKRNMELKSLKEAETRSKITIKTIMQQLGAVNNAILSNDNYQNKMNVYNSMYNIVQKKNVRKAIYVSKLEFYVDITKKLKYKFTKLSEISDLLKLELISEIEQQIFEKFAITEVELDKYIVENKDKMVTEYINRIIELKDIAITHENKNKLLEEAEHLQVIEEVFKEYIAEPYRESIYNFKFIILTFDINNQSEFYSKFQMYLPRDDYYKEKDYYIKIISEKINNINQGVSPFAKELQDEGKLKKMVKLLYPYFKAFDGKYRYEDILFNRELLAILLAFDNIKSFNNFFKEYKYYTNGKTVKESVHLPYYNFVWEDKLPLETFFTLYEVDGIEKPPFYDIYKIYHQEVHMPGRAPNFPDEIYYFPEGIRSINVDNLENSELIYNIREKSYHKIVVFPSSLKRISGDIFGFTRIKDIRLNNGLKYIGNDVFDTQDFTKISFPSSIEKIEEFSFNFSKIREIEFQDFKNSKLLYNLLYSNNEWVKKLIKKIFRQSYSEDYHPYIESSLSEIVLGDDDNIIKLTKSDILNCINYNVVNINNNLDKVQSNLSNLIEQKTGINIKEYQENSYKQKK